MKKPTIWFWVIAGIFLLWNAFGCYLYVLEVTLTDAQYAEMHGDVMAAARDFYPSWALAAFALASVLLCGVVCWRPFFCFCGVAWLRQFSSSR